MNPFTTVQRKKALVWLSLFHLLVITSSNYLVQLPISIFGFHTTWGAFSFPFIFLATDLTVRIFGAPLARRIIFAVMVPALAPAFLTSGLFAFLASMDNYAISIFLTDARNKTLPIEILRYLEEAPDPTIAAISSCLIVLAVVVLFVAERLVGMRRLAQF